LDGDVHTLLYRYLPCRSFNVLVEHGLTCKVGVAAFHEPVEHVGEENAEDETDHTEEQEETDEDVTDIIGDVENEEEA